MDFADNNIGVFVLTIRLKEKTMKKNIVSVENAARFFNLSETEFLDKTWGYKWSGAIQDINCWRGHENEDKYFLTGIGAFMPLPFLEKINLSDITAYMVQIQKICDEGDILEAFVDEIVSEPDRKKLLWLIDRVFLSDVVKYSLLCERVKKMALPVACFQCGARIGEVHRIQMCQHEECPFCEEQSFACDCVERELKLYDDKKYTAATSYLPPDCYENGISNEQHDSWMALCEIQGRKPFMGYSERN
jgi:hypothetical protein